MKLHVISETGKENFLPWHKNLFHLNSRAFIRNVKEFLEWQSIIGMSIQTYHTMTLIDWSLISLPVSTHLITYLRSKRQCKPFLQVHSPAMDWWGKRRSCRKRDHIYEAAIAASFLPFFYPPILVLFSPFFPSFISIFLSFFLLFFPSFSRSFPFLLNIFTFIFLQSSFVPRRNIRTRDSQHMRCYSYLKCETYKFREPINFFYELP